MRYVHFCFKPWPFLLTLGFAATQCRMPLSLTQSHTSRSDSVQEIQLRQQELAQLRAWQQGLLEQVTVEFFPPSPGHTLPTATHTEGSSDLNVPLAGKLPTGKLPPGTLHAPTPPAPKRITTTHLRTHSSQAQQHTHVGNATLQSQASHTENRNTDSAPAPDPYRWRYLFYSLLVVAALFVVKKLRLW